MLFTLEALNAKHGDCLLLHYGDASAPSTVLIDGGPRGVFNSTLKPRLGDLRASRTDGKPLRLALLMISHIDDDHIAGIVDLLKAVKGAPIGDRLVAIERLWHNSFGELVGGGGAALDVAAAGAVEVAATWDVALPTFDHARSGTMVIASVKQGLQVAALAADLNIPTNTPYPDLVTSEVNLPPVSISGGLTLKVIGPSAARLDALRLDWAKELKKLKEAGLLPADFAAGLASYADKAAANLSSIVVLATFGHHTMLLTGDARGDYILESLVEQGLLKNGRMYVDILKLQHHGSDRNIAPDFFQKVTATHYLISADGKYDNPDLDTLRMLVDARGQDEYNIHLTNDVPSVAEFLAKAQHGKRFKVRVREQSALSIAIDVGTDQLAD